MHNRPSNHMEKPTLAAYSLRRADVDEYHSLVQGSSSYWPKLIGYTAGFSIGGVFGIWLATAAYTERGGFILAIWFALLSGGLIAMALRAIIARVMLDVLHRQPQYRRIAEYLSDEVAYAAWKKRTEKEFWESLDGHQFEEELALVYRCAGYDVVIRPATGDQGIDLEIHQSGTLVKVVQCKAQKRPIGPGPVRELSGAILGLGVAAPATLASVSGFTKGARLSAQNQSIELLDLPDIIHLQELLGLEHSVRPIIRQRNPARARY